MYKPGLCASTGSTVAFADTYMCILLLVLLCNRKLRSFFLPGWCDLEMVRNLYSIFKNCGVVLGTHVWSFPLPHIWGIVMTKCSIIEVVQKMVRIRRSMSRYSESSRYTVN